MWWCVVVLLLLYGEEINNDNGQLSLACYSCPQSKVSKAKPKEENRRRDEASTFSKELQRDGDLFDVDLGSPIHHILVHIVS
jgi:hypothetical protein